MSLPSPCADPAGLAHRWKVLAVGVAANASFSVAFSGLPMTAVFMRSGYRLDDSTLGLVLGLMGLGIAVSELPWGLLTDRWGDRPVLLTGLGGTAMALIAMAVFVAPTATRIPSLPWLAAGLLVVGLLGGSVNGASGRAIMAWFGSGERGLAMSIRQTAVPLGGGIGALVLPALAVHAGFAAIYGVLALGCAATAGLAWRWLHEPPPASGAWPAASGASVMAAGAASDAISPDPSAPPELAELAELAEPLKLPESTPDGDPLHNPRVWCIVMGIGILCAPQFAVLSFGTVFLHDFAHLGLAQITTAMVALQLGAMATRIWSGRWTDQRDNRRAYLFGCAGLSVALFGMLAGAAMAAGRATQVPAEVAWALMVLLAVCGVAVSAWHGVAYTELATLAGARRAGTALGMANTAVFAICFVTPLGIPHLLAASGWGAVWLSAAACGTVALPLLTLASRRPLSVAGKQVGTAPASGARRLPPQTS